MFDTAIGLFYFFILTCGSYLVTRERFPLHTCIPVLSLYGGFSASSPAPLQRLKYRVRWRITALKVKQTLRSLQCSAVFQIHLCLIILAARLKHAMHVQSREKTFGERWAEFSHKSFLLYILYLHLLKWFHKITCTSMSFLVISFLLVMSLFYPSIHLGLTLHTFCLHNEINPVLGSAEECLNLWFKWIQLLWQKLWKSSWIFN